MQRRIQLWIIVALLLLLASSVIGIVVKATMKPQRERYWYTQRATPGSHVMHAA